MSDGESTEKRLAKETARVGVNVGLLLVARMAGLAMSLVQIGIIFRALSLAGQGEYQAAFNFASLFTVFATLGIQRLLVRDIARDHRVAWSYVWTALSVVGVLSCLCMAAIYFAKRDSDAEMVALWAGTYVVVTWALQRPFEALLIARERMGLVALLNVITGATKLLSVWLFLPRTVPSAESIVPPVYVHQVVAAANVVGLLLFVITAMLVGRVERPRIRLDAAIGQIRECLPFALAMLCSWVYFKSDMELLHHFRGNTDAGVYAPVQKLMEPLLMVAGLWGTAIFPALCRLSHTDTEAFQHIKATSVRLALLVACPMAVGLGLLAQPIILLLTGGDAGLLESTRVMQIVALILPLFYLNGIGQEFLYAAHRNSFVVWSYLLAAVVSVGLNLWAIPHHGVIGLAWVAVVANGVVSIMFCIGMRDELDFGGLALLLLRTAVACAVMGLVAWYGARVNVLF
ncbi:MAG: flippase, partial [Candidatus Hydrogenedentes bacterium]|nr:flippase [Candidatus Hydrogenedentota bacterium]